MVGTSQQTHINIWLDRNSGQSVPQFGDPQLSAQDTDFSNFDAQETLRRLEGDARSKDSLQARVLRANITHNVRVFDITGINGATVTNFFTQVIEAISREDCAQRKRQADKPICFRYRCLCADGCSTTPLCADGCEQCNLLVKSSDSQRTCVDKDTVNPANPCETCKVRIRIYIYIYSCVYAVVVIHIAPLNVLL